LGKSIFQLGIVLLGSFALIYLFVFFSPDRGEPPVERDFRAPRAPAEARSVANPFPASEEVVARGKEIYLGKGTCFSCHGTEGKGDGIVGMELRPRPRDFTNSEFQAVRTDGELFWVIRNGSPGTRMFSYSPSIITEEESWEVIHFIRTLARPVEEPA
jgi:mono/diheme cytochrome c family protein